MENEKLLNRDQKWRMSVMEWRLVRVVLCGVTIVLDIPAALVGAVELLAVEEKFVDVVSIDVTLAGEFSRDVAVATAACLTWFGILPLPSFSNQKSQACTRGGGRSFPRRAVRVSRPRAGEFVVSPVMYSEL